MSRCAVCLTGLLLGVVQLLGPHFWPPASDPGVHSSGLRPGPQQGPAPKVLPSRTLQRSQDWSLTLRQPQGWWFRTWVILILGACL